MAFEPGNRGHAGGWSKEFAQAPTLRWTLGMTAPIREGEILAGKYRVERVLAQGGMGIVVAAIHQQLDQRVALKFMLPKDAPKEADFGRFMREAKAAVRLRSEHVAKVLDVGTAETGSPYIVMEYLEGRDLDVVLQEQGPLPVEQAVTYVLQACEAVAEAHALGIVHRDLKPANLFLTRRADGTPCVKVLDFGISKLLEADEPALALTKTSAMMGTPVYMAPEQIRSSKEVDRRSDIWALGMILYELLTGRTAFVRDTLLELCSSILTDAPVPPHELRADIPPALSAAILRALEKDPAERYRALGQLVDALAPHCQSGYESAARVHRILGTSSSPALESEPRLSPSSARTAAPRTPISGESMTLDGAAAVHLRSVETPVPASVASPSRRTLPIVVGVVSLLVGVLAAITIGMLSKSGEPKPLPSVAVAPSPARGEKSGATAELVPAPPTGTLIAAPPPTSTSAASTVGPAPTARTGPAPTVAAKPTITAVRASASARAPEPADTLAPFGPRK